MTESAAELVAKIAALNLQLEQAKVHAQKGAHQSQINKQHQNDDDEEYEEYYEEEEYISDDEVIEYEEVYEEEEIQSKDHHQPQDVHIRSMDECKGKHASQKPEWATRAIHDGDATPLSPDSQHASHDASVQKMDELKQRHAFQKPQWTTKVKRAETEMPSVPPQFAGSDAHVQKMEQLKHQHAFSKPAWADPKGESHQSQQAPYQRHVPAKDVVLVPGQHVKVATKLEPRLAWIVVNVNKRKVGKIVMHLYGQAVPQIVDVFEDLKGSECHRHNGELVVANQPVLYVVAGGPSGLDSKANVHGVIQEGADIFQQVMNAPENASVTIKQAHIYPVKKRAG